MDTLITKEALEQAQTLADFLKFVVTPVLASCVVVLVIYIKIMHSKSETRNDKHIEEIKSLYETNNKTALSVSEALQRNTIVVEAMQRTQERLIDKLKD